MKIYQLTYTSHSLADITAGQIKDILTTSRKNNSKKNITGCLVYHHNKFIQIIEGKESEIKQLYKTIREDSRHNNVQLIWEGKSADRSFKTWAMSYYSSEIKPEDSSERKSFENNLLLLSEFMDSPSTTTRLFWVKIRLLLNKSDAS